MNKKKIIIGTGGTGGHIFPAESLFENLKENFNVQIITDKRGFKFIKDKNNLKVIDTVSISNKGIIKIIPNMIKIIISIIESYFFIRKFKPVLVLGMGGYSSFPTCVASFLLKIPVIIYENNLVIGKANKVLLPFVKKIIIANKNILGISKKHDSKVFFSGYFLRKEIFRIKREINSNRKNDLKILILGGSQSAKVFGDVIPQIILNCYKNDIKFKVYQQCLENQINNLRKFYNDNKINFELFTFSESLIEHYKNVDFAITRSGASSIAELINLKIPFVAIPLPSSADQHQFKNALNFKNKGFCFLLEEKYIKSKLFDILNDLNKNREKLILLKNKMQNHSDSEVLPKATSFIEKFINEKN